MLSISSPFQKRGSHHHLVAASLVLGMFCSLLAPSASAQVEVAETPQAPRAVGEPRHQTITAAAVSTVVTIQSLDGNRLEIEDQNPTSFRLTPLVTSDEETTGPVTITVSWDETELAFSTANATPTSVSPNEAVWLFPNHDPNTPLPVIDLDLVPFATAPVDTPLDVDAALNFGAPNAQTASDSTYVIELRNGDVAVATTTAVTDPTAELTPTTTDIATTLPNDVVFGHRVFHNASDPFPLSDLDIIQVFPHSAAANSTFNGSWEYVSSATPGVSDLVVLCTTEDPSVIPTDPTDPFHDGESVWQPCVGGDTATGLRYLAQSATEIAISDGTTLSVVVTPSNVVSGSIASHETSFALTSTRFTDRAKSVDGATVEFVTPSLSGSVWVDTDVNGTIDVGEQLIVGAAVTLQDTTGASVATTTTSPTGDYAFLTGVAPGESYTIEVDPSTLGVANVVNVFDPDDGVSVTPPSTAITVPADVPFEVTDVNFGFALPPAVTVTKEAFDHANGLWVSDGSAVVSPRQVDWQITVTNTGLARLYSVTTSDVRAPGCSFVVPQLDPGESVVQACAESGLTVGSLTNTATTTATPSPALDPTLQVSASADETVTVVELPVLTIQKTINSIDADTTTDFAVVPVGEPARIEFEVANLAASGEPVAAINVFDSVLGPITCPTNSLQPGESFTCSVQIILPEGAYTSNATASAAGAATGVQVSGVNPELLDTSGNPLDPTVTLPAGDPANAFTPTAQIAIEKLVIANSTFGAAVGSTQADPVVVTPGETLRFVYNVTLEAGANVPVGSVTVNDNIEGPAAYVSGDTDSDELLDAGETWRFEILALAIASEHQTTATTTAELQVPADLTSLALWTPSEIITSATDAAFTSPGGAVLSLLKSTNGFLDAGAIEVNDLVVWEYLVSLAAGSTVPVGNVAVLDDLQGSAVFTGGDVNGNSLLDAGEIWTYELRALAELGQYNVGATAFATPAVLGPTGATPLLGADGLPVVITDTATSSHRGVLAPTSILDTGNSDPLPSTLVEGTTNPTALGTGTSAGLTGNLPTTGSNSARLAMVALLLLAAGTVLATQGHQEDRLVNAYVRSL